MLEVSHKQSNISYLFLIKKAYENGGVWLIAHDKEFDIDDTYNDNLALSSEYKFALKIDNTFPNAIEIIKYVTSSDDYDYTFIDNNSQRQYVKIITDELTTMNSLSCKYSLLVKTMIDFSDVDTQQFSSSGEYKSLSLVYKPSETRSILNVENDVLNSNGFLIATSTVTTGVPNTYIVNSMDKLHIEFYIDFILDKDEKVLVDSNCNITLAP